PWRWGPRAAAIPGSRARRSASLMPAARSSSPSADGIGGPARADRARALRGVAHVGEGAPGPCLVPAELFEERGVGGLEQSIRGAVRLQPGRGEGDQL